MQFVIHSHPFSSTSHPVQLYFNVNYTMTFRAVSPFKYDLDLFAHGDLLAEVQIPVTSAVLPIGDFRGWVGIVYVNYFSISLNV